MEKHRSDEMLNNASKFVTVKEEEEDTQEADDPERIEVDFDELRKLNSDVVGWIYCANTKLNYPVAQASNNDYYLHRLLDGSWNANGTIFMDYRNGSDLSDKNTLIYGHHMMSGAMFGQLIDYKKQSFYEEHPYLYYMTDSQTYRVDLLAGCVVDSTDSIYSTVPDESLIQRCMSNSTFSSQKSYQGGNIMTFSTCTYEYDDARYIVLGELVPVE